MEGCVGTAWAIGRAGGRGGGVGRAGYVEEGAGGMGPLGPEAAAQVCGVEGGTPQGRRGEAKSWGHEAEARGGMTPERLSWRTWSPGRSMKVGEAS